MYEEKMELMNGTCPYCGQVIAVKAMDQQDADLKAADECNCEKAARARRYKGANSYLQQLIAGERCRAAGFVELSEKQIQLASLALESVCKDDVPSAQINLEDSALKIAAKAEGKIAVTRTRKVRMRAEV